MKVGPHPHIGLETVTCHFKGEVLHRNSVESQQRFLPGQLHLTSAGNRITHSGKAPKSPADKAHGVQLWIAQPAATRDSDPAFERHSTLPAFWVDNSLTTVVTGNFGGLSSPVRIDSNLGGSN